MTLLDFKDKKVVISTDILVEGVHFDLAYMPLKHLGYKAVTTNISDICAMNAKATQNYSFHRVLIVSTGGVR
jgi:thiamine-monophosphate kinase